MEKGFTQTSPYDLRENVFKAFNNDWMLITAMKPDGSVNTMTGAWGGFGIMWSKPVFTCVVRPQRYTFGFTEAAGVITLSFFGGDYKKELGYLGKVSGRDEDKIAKSGLTLVRDGESAYFGEASMVLVGRKIYVDDLRDEAFIDREILSRNYNGDLHRVYTCEILSVLKK